MSPFEKRFWIPIHDSTSTATRKSLNLAEGVWPREVIMRTQRLRDDVWGRADGAMDSVSADATVEGECQEHSMAGWPLCTEGPLVKFRTVDACCVCLKVYGYCTPVQVNRCCNPLQVNGCCVPVIVNVYVPKLMGTTC